MTGRDRIRCAFEPDGTSEIGVVVSYDGIFMRDHWAALTDVPWWYAQSGLLEHEIGWAQDVCTRTGIEWLTVRPCRPRDVVPHADANTR